MMLQLSAPNVTRQTNFEAQGWHNQKDVAELPKGCAHIGTSVAATG